MEIINLCLTDPKNSNVNPYEENINVYQKQGMDNLYYINNIVDYEIFVGIKLEKEEKQNIVLSEFSNNKIIPFKYIDEIGSLNINFIKQNKYYTQSHPFHLTRDNPIFEIPSNINIKQLKEMFYSELIPFKNLNSGNEVENEKQIDEVEKYQNSNIVDLYYDIQSLKDFRSKITNSKLQSNIDFNSPLPLYVNDYEPNLPILSQF